VLLTTRPQVNHMVTVNPRLANRAVNRVFLQPALYVCRTTFESLD